MENTTPSLFCEPVSILAWHVCDTDQLLCSSCQWIYVDTDDLDRVFSFAGRFFKYSIRRRLRCPGPRSRHLLAQKTLELHTEQLEACHVPKKVFRTERCGGVAYADSTPTPSYQFRNCWVRPLPRTQRVAQLRPHKNYLLTAGLLCDANERTALEALLLKAGVVRIASGEHMSHSYCGMPHDGEFLLRR